MFTSSFEMLADTSATIRHSGKNTPNQMTAIFSVWPIPNQMIISGRNADAGM